jgi:hypothetical protein
MTGFEAYKMYLGIKSHFDPPKKYSYIKYQGMVNANPITFERRRDRYYFEKLSKKDDLLNFLLANFLEGDIWVRDLFDADSEDRYVQWQRRNQSLTYNFERELSGISGNFKSYFVVEKGQHPNLLKEHRQGNISIETLTILNDLMNFFPYWDKRISDNILWPKTRDTCLKYAEFIKYDKPKMKKIVKDILDVQ